MGTAMEHPVPDRIKPSFLIFDIRALWRSALSLQMAVYQVWHRMLYSCTHLTTVDVKELKFPTTNRPTGCATFDSTFNCRHSSPTYCNKRMSCLYYTVFPAPKHVKITLWIENDGYYFSSCHEKPSICNVCVKFHSNYPVRCWDVAFYKKTVENCVGNLRFQC